ncbi:MAG: hypothetical protein BWY65_01941 [Firmicutes bacterium ADurb.Bin373]|nr:MAG: hypothetical protein BWY65_01941 [Firmicutes bacterium ADurb.Bin373]
MQQSLGGLVLLVLGFFVLLVCCRHMLCLHVGNDLADSCQALAVLIELFHQAALPGQEHHPVFVGRIVVKGLQVRVQFGPGVRLENHQGNLVHVQLDFIDSRQYI